jgi:hypothetical protein
MNVKTIAFLGRIRNRKKKADKEQGDVHEAFGVHGYAMPSGDILVFQKVTEKSRILPRRVSHRHRHMNQATLKLF